MDSARGYIQNTCQLAWQLHGAFKLEEFQHRDLEASLLPGFIILVAGLGRGRRGTWGTDIEMPLRPRLIPWLLDYGGRKRGPWYIGFRGSLRVLEELTSTDAFLCSPTEVTVPASNQCGHKYTILPTSSHTRAYLLAINPDDILLLYFCSLTKFPESDKWKKVTSSLASYFAALRPLLADKM